MRKIIIIGTLHAGLTPNKELQKILAKYNPAQVLVEIAHEDLNNTKFEFYPSEMVFAYNWAKSRNIPVAGFDSKINVFRDGSSDDQNQKAIAEQKQIMKKYTWIDMNKEVNSVKLNTPSARIIIDKAKDNLRNQDMLKNIKKKMIGKGTILILTGCNHLSFFEKKISTAQFPFR